jgi:hypothetical protein
MFSLMLLPTNQVLNLQVRLLSLLILKKKQHEAEHVVVLLDLVEVVDPVYVAPLVVGKMVDFVEQDIYMHVFVVVVVELDMRVVAVISLQYLVLLHVEVGTVVLVANMKNNMHTLYAYYILN